MRGGSPFQSKEQYNLTFLPGKFADVVQFKLRKTAVEKVNGDLKIKKEIINSLNDYTDMDKLLANIVTRHEGRDVIVANLTEKEITLEELKEIFTNEQYTITAFDRKYAE